MKRFGILNTSLNPPEVGAGTCQFDNRQIFDVGLGYLRPVGFQGFDFLFERIGYINKNVGGKILGCSSFIKQNIAYIPRG